ncbi:MAG: class C sortase [Clostridia bacterium]|nr:class C sortase [Clostridia bacterium]
MSKNSQKNKKKNRRSTLTTFLLFFILAAGLGLLLYPSVSNYWNSFHQTKAIANYADEVANMENEEYDRIWQQAVAYNESLQGRQNQYLLSDEQRKEYESLLDVTGTGIMGYIEIESIGVSLPLYHGTGDAVLQIAIGHLDWTSLPVGGEGSHCVVSGHRGLPRAKLFTDLDKLTVGDLFVMRILDEVLTYEVDQILIVDPHVTEDLLIEDGKDYCTLVTCTPYGINSHRLLVRGHRVENVQAAKTVRVTADAVQIEPMLVAPILAAPVLLLLLLSVLIKDSTKSKTKKEEENDDEII